MIATKEMPVTIGVFVRPGDLPAPMKGTLGRRNRCFEYDGVSDNNVRFLDRGAAAVRRQGIPAQALAPTATTAASPAAAAAASRRSPPRGNGPTPSAACMPRAAAGSPSAAGTSFPTLVRKFEAQADPRLSHHRHARHGELRRRLVPARPGDGQGPEVLRLRLPVPHHRRRPRRRLHGALPGGDGLPLERLARAREGRPERAACAGDPPFPARTGSSSPRASRARAARPATPRARCSSPTPRTTRSTASAWTATSASSSPTPAQAALRRPSARMARSITVSAELRQDHALRRGGQRAASSWTASSATRILARPDGSLYVTTERRSPNSPGSVWFVKDGKKTRVDSGIKFATGLAYRPDQWLLSVADGHSKWVYSYQIKPTTARSPTRSDSSGLHVADWDDDAGAECVCYSIEGRQFVATRMRHPGQRR